MSDQPQFQLDGQPIPFQPGDTIMQAAHRAGVYIPHLCFHPQFRPHGSCRLCVVNMQGKTVSACTQPASIDLEVHSETTELRQSRLRLIQLLFAEGNHFCPSCETSGNCQLQALAYDLGMTHYHYDPFYPTRIPDGSHPELFIDRDRCIQCDLCGRASEQADHKAIYLLAGRGQHTHVAFRSDDGELGSTQAQAEDRASHVCPVGCILPKSGNYPDIAGARLYDQIPIHAQGNHRRDDGGTHDD
ncbi:2Fe-2S iron-sulfur cluster-binding protein [Ketobacter sp.]|uniref:2Fe-2S iron-sulfur cluster-binding protein n=1 Tax=Ketobacter sp. TaxID=2083498 RepID=UPI000F1DDD18|nr:2Fe-2S iron-sulfur cluster-binding protein [Ketobacter sp.]RLU01540.1 MAG: NADP oxidoreductase [Ketobacter sp.]